MRRSKSLSVRDEGLERGGRSQEGISQSDLIWRACSEEESVKVCPG